MFADAGFGSPTGYGLYDAGFGSPSIILSVKPYPDNGFGSPYSGIDFYALEKFQDDGGYRAELIGGWVRGQYYVYVKKHNVLTDWILCYGGEPFQNDPYACSLNKDGNLEFIVPPLLVGTYDVVVQQIDGISIWLKTNVFTVVYRNRKKEIYSVRRMFPRSVYNVSKIRIDEEEILT